MRRLRLTVGEKISLVGNLGTMLRAGIPILEAVNTLLVDSRGNGRKVLQRLWEDLTQGKQVAESLAAYPEVIDRVSLNLIKAAEEAGTLETTLKDLQEHWQKDTEFVDRVKFALLYPVVIVVVFIGVLLTILIVVVPRMAMVFSRLKVVLPWPTRALIVVSNILLHQTAWIIGGLVVVGLGVSLVISYRRRWLMEMAYRLPGVAGLIRQIDLARFCRNMYLLLSSGLPITTALGLSAEVVLGKKMAALVSKSREMVVGGKRLSDGVRQGRGLVPALMIKLIEAGERTGTLDSSLQEVSVHMEYQIGNTLKALTAILEPAMLVVVGVIVGGVMLSVIAPIYNVIGQVGG